MKKLVILTIIIVTGWLLVLSFEEFEAFSDAEINERLNYLERVINEPLNSNSEIDKIGKESGEWMLFSYSFSTYAFMNIAIDDSLTRPRAISNIKTSIDNVLTSEITRMYGVEPDELYTDALSEISVLYLGHLNLMLGCYRMLSADSSYNSLNDRISQSLYDRYATTNFLSLESYPSAIWIPDNTVALASLKMHSRNTGSEFESMCVKWVSYAKANFVDPKTKVLYSTVDPMTGHPGEEPRGSMIGWSIMFISKFDEDFAKNLYDNYKENFSDNYLILRLFKERANSFQIDIGDIDSGPIVLGYSIPANEFALSGSIISEDYGTAQKILRLINLGTSRVKDHNELKYNVRFLDLVISPMAEALVLNSVTTRQWTLPAN